jgi:GDP-4-dehydro-6-deoxy-D-mannose reductase
MKVLITGAPGFVGRHMAAELLRSGHEVYLTGVADESVEIYGFGKKSVVKMDITSPAECNTVIKSVGPDTVIHLAGLAQTVGHNTSAFRAVNITGAGHVAEALKHLSNANPKTFLFVSSAFVYGGDASSGTFYCGESARTSPRGAYGESKLEAENLVRSLEDKNFHVYVARPFNHIGPGQDLSFVVPGLATKIKNAAAESTIETGNLTSLRDFTDVRDVVRAYRLIIEKGPGEKTFVI